MPDHEVLPPLTFVGAILLTFGNKNVAPRWSRRPFESKQRRRAVKQNAELGPTEACKTQLLDAQLAQK